MKNRDKVIITGSSGLIGKSVANYFKRMNVHVLGLDMLLGHDLTDEEFVKSWFRKNKASYLINLFAFNDHVAQEDKREGLFNISLDSFREFMEINVTALFSVCREFAKNKEARGIVNFSSIYGIVSPLPFLYKNGEKHIGYSASKGAVIQLSRHLAVHLAPRVRVNCIAPGGIEYRQDAEFRRRYKRYTPMRRMMKTEELNKLIKYLCSDESSYMTGSIITIDGGWTAW
ncbi:MAG: SDR family oxidoreductase [Candidatus Omnitrophota bacterium]